MNEDVFSAPRPSQSAVAIHDVHGRCEVLGRLGDDYL